MAITWTEWNNGGSLITLRTGLNSFNNSVVSAVNTNTADIEAISSNVSSNTTDISTNTDTINTIDGRLNILEGFHSYDSTSVDAITITNDVYEDILN